MSSEVQERRRIIKLVLSNLRVEDKLVCYKEIKPFDTILNYADRQAWLHLMDSFRTNYAQQNQYIPLH